MLMKIGAVVGGLALAWMVVASMAQVSMSAPLLFLVVGLVLLIAGFLRGETRA